MRLIIDIDEKKYEEIKRIAKAQFELTDKTEAQIIADGIPYEPKGEWIPVSERLPKPRVAVMVYCPQYKNQYCAFYENKHWQVFGARDTIWTEVTHWKPLSHDPYESEATNEQIQ